MEREEWMSLSWGWKDITIHSVIWNSLNFNGGSKSNSSINLPFHSSNKNKIILFLFAFISRKSWLKWKELKIYYNSISRQTGIQTKVKKIDDFDEMIMESNKSIWIEFDWMKVWWRRSPFNSFISFLSSLPNGKREEMNWVDGHCGMDGNEVWVWSSLLLAGRLWAAAAARQGAQREDERRQTNSNGMSFSFPFFSSFFLFIILLSFFLFFSFYILLYLFIYFIWHLDL